MNSLIINNINKYTNLDDSDILNFELRLKKNSNDYLDYIKHLKTKTTSTPEQLIYLYLKLIVVYGNEIDVVIDLWKYLIEVYDITNENALSEISESFFEILLKSISDATIVSMLRFFASTKLESLKFYAWDLIIKLFNNQKFVNIFTAYNSKTVAITHDSYGAFYNFAGYLPFICGIENLDLTSQQVQESKLLFKYLTALHVSEKDIEMSLVKRVESIRYLKSLHDIESLYIYYDKLEKDSLQYCYYALIKLLTDEEFRKSGKPVINKVKQLLTGGLKKANRDDVFVLNWLCSLLDEDKLQVDIIVNDLQNKLDNTSNINQFQVYYDILIELLKMSIAKKLNGDESMLLLEAAILQFEGKRMVCLLKENVTNFHYWRHYLTFNNFDRYSLEYFLTTVELNSNKTYSLKHVVPGELGDIWTKYANIFGDDIEKYRTVIKCSLNMNYFHYQDVELILINWMNKEQESGNTATFTELIEKLIGYTDVIKKNDNIANALESSKRLWRYFMDESKGMAKVEAYKKMTEFGLITTDTVDYITSYVFKELEDKSLFFKLWFQAFTVLFINSDEQLKAMFKNFTLQLAQMSQFDKTSFTKQIVKTLISKVELNKKEFWIKKYVNLIAETAMNTSEKIYTLNKTIMDYITQLKSHYLLEKWVEMVSNITANSISQELLEKIRYSDLIEILKAYDGLAIVSSKLPTTIINLEETLSNNVERTRELYIYFAQMLPPNFNNEMETLWKNWEEFEIRNGKLKDLIRWRKDITSTFQQLGYQRSSATITKEKPKSNNIEFVKARSVKAETDENELLKIKEEA